MKRIALILAICACVAVPVRAELIQNGSFESGAFVGNSENIMSLPVGSTIITGWTVVNDEVAWINEPNPYNITTPSGALLLDLTDYDNTVPHGGVSQTITTAVGQNYALSLDLGVLNGGPYGSALSSPISVRVSAGGTTQDFVYDPAGGGNQWQSFGFNFVAGSTATDVTITGLSGAAYIGVDNVSVVPVPGAVLLGMLGLSLAGVKLRKRA